MLEERDMIVHFKESTYNTNSDDGTRLAIPTSVGEFFCKNDLFKICIAETKHIPPESTATVLIFFQAYNCNDQWPFIFKNPTLLSMDNGMQPTFVAARGIIQAGGTETTTINISNLSQV